MEGPGLGVWLAGFFAGWVFGGWVSFSLKKFKDYTAGFFTIVFLCSMIYAISGYRPGERRNFSMGCFTAVNKCYKPLGFLLCAKKKLHIALPCPGKMSETDMKLLLLY